MGQGRSLRVSELAALTRVPVATIKYYLREGLLPAGVKITPRLTEYDERHVRQLGLLRILREVGHVSVDGLRHLTSAVRENSGSVHDLFGAATDALAPTPQPAGELRDVTRAMADQLIEEAGWSNIRPNCPDRENLAAAMEVVATYDTHPRDPAELTPYARFADQIARYEIGHLDDTKDRIGLLEEMVVGQVAFGQVLSILRRLAEEHHSFDRFGADYRS